LFYEFIKESEVTKSEWYTNLAFRTRKKNTVQVIITKKKKNNNLIFTLYFSIQIAFVTALVAAEKLQGSLTTLKTVVFFPVRTDLQKMLNLQLNESKMGH
jgi:hypothetical protein